MQKNGGAFWVLRIAGFSLLFVFSMALGALLIAYSSAGLVYDYRDTVLPPEKLKDVDVIVCLAGAKGRIKEAAELWFAYYRRNPSNPPKLYLSGLGPKAHWAVVAPQIPEEARGVLKVSDIVMENQSTNTVENAEWFAQASDKEKWKRLVLVTSSYHMRRSLYIFRKTLGEDYQIELYSIRQEPFTLERWMTDADSIRITLWEFLKWSYFRAFYEPSSAR